MIKIGLIASTFDLLHAGHTHFIRTAANSCDQLICCLQTNIPDRPDKRKPVQTVYERYLQLSAIKGVDRIIPYESEFDLCNLLVTQTHHLRFLGTDYELMTDKITGSSLYGGRVFYLEDLQHGNVKEYPSIVLLPRYHDYSTSELRNRITNASK